MFRPFCFICCYCLRSCMNLCIIHEVLIKKTRWMATTFRAQVEDFATTDCWSTDRWIFQIPELGKQSQGVVPVWSAWKWQHYEGLGTTNVGIRLNASSKSSVKTVPGWSKYPTVSPPRTTFSNFTCCGGRSYLRPENGFRGERLQEIR